MGKVQGTPDEPRVSQIYRGFLLGLADSIDQDVVSSVVYQVRSSRDGSIYGDWLNLATEYATTGFQSIHDSLYVTVYYQYRCQLHYTDGTVSDLSDYAIPGNGQTSENNSIDTLDQLASSLGTITAGYLRGVIFETSANYPKVRMDPTGFYAISTTATPVKIDAATGNLTLIGGTITAPILQTAPATTTSFGRIIMDTAGLRMYGPYLATPVLELNSSPGNAIKWAITALNSEGETLASATFNTSAPTNVYPNLGYVKAAFTQITGASSYKLYHIKGATPQMVYSAFSPLTPGTSTTFYAWQDGTANRPTTGPVSFDTYHTGSTPLTNTSSAFFFDADLANATLTGTTIRSNETDPKIQLDDTGFIATDSGANNLFTITPGMGASYTDFDTPFAYGVAFRQETNINSGDMAAFRMSTPVDIPPYQYVKGISFVNSSDAMLKLDIEPVEDSVLDKLNRIKTYTYNWDQRSHRKDIGLLAHEIHAEFPLATQLDTLGTPVGYDTSALIAILLQSVNELSKRIQVLENE